MCPACWITDHSERGVDDITPEALQFPASGHEEVDPATLPRFAFDTTSIDMGRMSQGTSIEREFRFINRGGSDLIIADVRGSCGCTVGKEWPKHPIRPGEGGAIAVEFNSEGRSGIQEKTVTVVANTVPSTTVLFLRGEVLDPTPNP
ncbi:MAG: DUF1573 domain-containing protein [Flavobacteriales bacterium]|nr:DUF1573 domain-containing protein [Flavobacteriales bacterium]